VVQSLLTRDVHYNIVPLLATDWEFNADYTALTMHLRQGVKFHDGTPFNAKAAKYCLDLSRESPTEGQKLNQMKSVDVIDNYTIRFNAVTAFDPSFLINLAEKPGWVASPTAIETRSEEDNLYYPVGTGPFKVSSFERDVSIKFERSDDYWQEGKPYLDGIEIIFVADQTVRMASFKAGEAQAISSLTGKELADAMALGLNYNLSYSGSIGIVFDSKNTDSPLANLLVRQAVTHAIDRQAISRALGYGIWQVCDQIYPPVHPAYNPDVVGYPYDVAKTKELLAQAGYPNGVDTELTTADWGVRKDLYTMVQSYLNEAGINTKLNVIERSLWTEIWNTGWTGMLDCPFIGSQPDGEASTPLINTISSTAPRNVSLAIPADYDAKLQVALNELDLQKRIALFQELSKMIIDDYCMCVPIYANPTGCTYTDKVHDLDMRAMGHYWSPANIWLSK
jgi:peptide/nickel transport system substrate-binding protein